MSLELEAWVTVGFLVSGQAHFLGLAGKFIPYASAVTAGGISVGDATEIGEAGRIGSMLLAGVRAPIEAGFLFDVTSGAPAFSWHLDCGLELQWLTGNLTAYARLLTEKATKVIAEWPGYTASAYVGAGEGTLTLDPPSSACALTRPLSLSSPAPPADVFRRTSAAPFAHRPVTFEDAIRVLAEPSLTGRGEALSILKRLFRRGEVSPENITRQLNTPVAPLVLAALGADGSSGSLTSLVNTFQDPLLPESVRVMAAVSLGASPRVTLEAVEALRHTTTSSPILEETLTYAVANGADTLSARYPALAEEVARELIDRTASGRTSREQVIAARALGNLHAKTARTALEGFAERIDNPALSNAAREGLGRAVAPEP